jgi:acyl-CoA synthetase (AMP-forming)/AMP-acid ligase II
MIRSHPGFGDAVPAVPVAQAVLGERPPGGRPALIDATSGRHVSYAQLRAAVTAAASGLAAAGLGRGSVIGLHVPDTPEFALAAYGVLAAGAVLAPVRPQLSVRETGRQLAAAGARALITWPVLLDIALEAVKETEIERVLSFGAEPDVESFTGLLTGGPAPPPPAPHDLALLPYTRGAAGPPRRVPLTHRNLVAGLVQFAAAGVLSGSDVVLSGIPFADVVGLNGVLGPALHLGATVVTRPGTGRHDLLRTLQDHRVTVAVLPPRMAEILAYDRLVARYHLRSLRSVIVTGGPLAPEVARACSVRLHCPVRQAYGLAEASGFTHVNLRAAEEGTLDSVGRGLPWVRWRIVDPAGGNDQPSYRPGELRVRGPMTTGPAAAWVATGDVAFADDHGRVYVLGRLGDGPHEPPTDPGAVLGAHPAVADAVVIPAPDPEFGLVQHAFVVLREGGRGDDLLAYANTHLPSYLQVAAVHLVDAIPRSPSGRVLRRALLERARLSPQDDDHGSPEEGR